MNCLRMSPGTVRKPAAMARKCSAQAALLIDGGRRYCTIAVIISAPLLIRRRRPAPRPAVRTRRRARPAPRRSSRRRKGRGRRGADGGRIRSGHGGARRPAGSAETPRSLPPPCRGAAPRLVAGDDAVDRARPLRREQAGGDIRGDRGGIALERIAKTADATAPQPDHFADLRAVDRAFADVVRRHAGADADAAAGGAGAAARRPPAREAMAVLAAHDDDRARVADLELVLDPEAAALTARPLAVGAQGKAAHEDGASASSTSTGT